MSGAEILICKSHARKAKASANYGSTHNYTVSWNVHILNISNYYTHLTASVPGQPG